MDDTLVKAVPKVNFNFTFDFFKKEQFTTLIDYLKNFKIVLDGGIVVNDFIYGKDNFGDFKILLKTALVVFTGQGR